MFLQLTTCLTKKLQQVLISNVHIFILGKISSIQRGHNVVYSTNIRGRSKTQVATSTRTSKLQKYSFILLPFIL
jgi:hypothetical protein